MWGVAFHLDAGRAILESASWEVSTTRNRSRSERFRTVDQGNIGRLQHRRHSESWNSVRPGRAKACTVSPTSRRGIALRDPRLPRHRRRYRTVAGAIRPSTAQTPRTPSTVAVITAVTVCASFTNNEFQAWFPRGPRGSG